MTDATNGARFCPLDLKDFFLASPMADAEYMRITMKYIPPDVIQCYLLSQKVHSSHI